MNNQAKTVKALIGSSESNIMSVTFKKANGDLRKIVFNPKTAKGLKGDAACEQAKQAVATRKANNPNLVNVCDMELLSKGTPADKAWRSFDCTRVVEVSVNKSKTTFEA